MDELNSALASLIQHEAGTMSLLPLEERKAYLILDNYTEEELRNFSVDTMLEKLQDEKGGPIEIPSDATSIWQYIKDEQNGVETYKSYLIGGQETINLSQSNGSKEFQLELVIGKDGQLNEKNVRYIIKCILTNEIAYTINDLSFSIFTESISDSSFEGRKVIIPGSETVVDSLMWSYTYVLKEPISLDTHKGYLCLNSKLLADPRISIKVYELATQKDITEQILPEDSASIGSGYNIVSDDNLFLVEYYFDGTLSHKSIVSVLIAGGYLDFKSDMYSIEGGIRKDVVYEESNRVLNGVLTVQSELKDGYPSDSEYYCTLDVTLGKNTHCDNKVVKVVEGLYPSLEEAANKPDIKEELLETGYKANYGGDGVNFTLFFEDGWLSGLSFYYLTIRAIDNEHGWKEFTEKPIIGAADPWFRVTGAKDSDGNDYDTYIIENGKNINIDTMYGYGYQTIFINQDVDSFIPTFWKANEEAISIDKIYANGSEFKEGSALSFPDGENVLDATFSVIITDKNGTHPKNYDVTFVKKASGPQLYVAGPLAPEVRSVFLDEYHENKHDIFIANIGDEPLTNLWLDLDATNVELDEYWMVGGEGNNTLSACPENFSLELDSTTYGELSNVAKIRLVPPSSGKGGAIQGTLKIYSGEEGNAANSELLATINLSDLAQNPEITTQKIDEAVKYVPYSCLITTNNMYDWVDVSYELTEGSLPDGIELIEETGELYGVPTVTGTFTFTVSTHFESTSENYAFEPSSVKLTLTVNENTDDNVFNATDIAENYSILNSIGVDNAGDHHYILEESADTVFRSEGELKQFVNLWLNGVLLEPGVDYIAESGSTKITIKAQTFDSDKTRKDGQRNTIAAEFRTTDTGSKNDKNNSNELRRTSQNFYIEKHTHSYDGGTITKAPTCIETGVRTYTCNTCGNKYTETIAALGHFSGEGKVTKKATCTDNGEKSYFCIRCNTLMRTEAIIAVGHDYSVKITQGGDCKTDGIKTYTCKNCGDSYTETIKATGHKYVAEVTIEPTETTDGLRTFTCSVCNDKFTEVIPALGDGTHLHTYDEGSVIQEATCLENGMMAYTCTQCGAIKQETILSKGHNYSEEIITEATCTESGLKKLTCVNCGDSYTAIIAAKGHSYDQGVVTKQPTNTETGIKTYTCSACGNSYTEVTPMINSTPVYGGLNNPSVETVVPNNQVACIVCLIDSNENPIGNTAVELHSAPQCFVTDSNGYVRFSAVDFGVHTLYVSNADGERISKEFHLTSGNSTSLEGDVITAEPGTAIVLTVVFDGNMLEIKGVQKSGSPETGDNSALAFWYVLMLVSLGCIVVMSYFSIKKKISNRH